MALFEELKRRKVFQVAFSYLIIAWLLTQVSDTLAPALRLPEWFHSGVVFLLILGFPVALFFAWAFELTPDGLQKDPGASQATADSRGSRLNVLVIALLAVALGYFVYDEFFIERHHGSAPEELVAAEQTAPDAGDKSIAVLPFVDMSPDKDQEYMSDGISEEMLNLLAKLPDLRVTSRSSAFAFKGKDIDIPTVAEKLGVAYILEGSVRKAGNQLRITAQLIETSSDSHLWSETYDRTLEDVFAIQDEISAAVVEALKLTLLGEAPRAQVIDEEAYTLVLQARYFWNRRAPGDVSKALDLYQQALELEPEYALAWTGVSVALAVQAFANEIPREDGMARAREAAEKALALDPLLVDAHVRMSQAQSRAEEYDAAMNSLRRALEIDPNSVLAMGVMGLRLRNLGQIEEALELLRRTVELDPLAAVYSGNYATALIQAERLDEAEAQLHKYRELNPAGSIELDLATIALLRGQTDEALRLAMLAPEGDRSKRVEYMVAFYHAAGNQELAEATLHTMLDDPDTFKYQLPGALASMGDLDGAFQALDPVLPDLDHFVGLVQYDPLLKNLRSDPRWEPLLEKIRNQK